MKCVIPCAGKGTRMDSSTPKVLLKVNSRTLLGHITCHWSHLVDGYVIVVNRENESLIRHNSGKAEFAVQEEPKGLADAILQAEPYTDGKFIVALGDCLYEGIFARGNFELGIGVWRTNNLIELNKNYLVEVKGQYVSRFTEKPNLIEGWHNCGMGVYFLDKRVFGYIRAGPKGFTEVLQTMIDAGEKMTPIWFAGMYINVTYPEDIRKAEEALK